jgi:hypothetical protein
MTGAVRNLRGIFMRYLFIAVSALALTACPQSEDSAHTQGTEVSSTGKADVSDGMIVCDMQDFDGMKGLTLTQTFILLDGKVKRYTAFDNTAFDLCEPGQENCSLALDGNQIAMDHLNESDVRSRYVVNLAAMEIEPFKTQPGEEEKLMSFREGDKCERKPLPEGMQVR